VWLLAAYGQPTGRQRLAPFHIYHMNRVNSRGGFNHDDITINIIILIIIIIIIIIVIITYSPANSDRLTANFCPTSCQYSVCQLHF